MLLGTSSQLVLLSLSFTQREAELAASEKKSAYELEQAKESARAAYDALRTEKEDLKVELAKSDERKNALESEISHFQSLMSTYSSKSNDLQTHLEFSESQRTRLQTGRHFRSCCYPYFTVDASSLTHGCLSPVLLELEHVQASYKNEVQELKSKLQSLEQQQSASQEQTKLLDAQFQRESSNHAETRERLHDSEVRSDLPAIRSESSLTTSRCNHAIPALLSANSDGDLPTEREARRKSVGSHGSRKQSREEDQTAAAAAAGVVALQVHGCESSVRSRSSRWFQRT